MLMVHKALFIISCAAKSTRNQSSNDDAVELR